MSGEFLIDTNILVYAYDRSEPAKQIQARNILDDLAKRSAGVLSTQILAEFYTTVTQKLAKPLTREEAYRELELFLRGWRTLDVSRYVVLEAAAGVARYQMSFWDAQIWATAKLNQIPMVLSDDFSNGSRIEGVQFLNPFVTPIPHEG
jgi:predicted nucleic acid-binding protein